MDGVPQVAPHDSAADELYAGLFDAPPLRLHPPPSVAAAAAAAAAAKATKQPDQQQHHHPLRENNNIHTSTSTPKGALVALFDEARLADLERAAADARRDAADARAAAERARAAERAALDAQLVLRRNISSLWLTARLEVGRLREEVAELRARVRKGQEGALVPPQPQQRPPPPKNQHQHQNQQHQGRPPHPHHHTHRHPHEQQQQQQQQQQQPQQQYHPPLPHLARPHAEQAPPPAKRPRSHDRY